MVDDKNHTNQERPLDKTAARVQPDPSLEATVTNLDDSTDQHLESLVRSVTSITDDSFENEPQCADFIKRLCELGPPEVTVRELGQYELISQIGRGGMGEVWKAKHKKLNRTVALKLLHPRISQSREAADRFEQEMRAIGALQHENIVQALDAGEVDGVLYLAMEHVQGTSLSDALKKLAVQGKQLSVKKASLLMTQAARGLQYAHDNGIVHRDIKPSNMMITAKGQVKLLDMGLARIASSDAPMPELTAEGQVMGTLDYMPPEQLRDSRSADVAADIYALGATFYKLLSGRAPFADETTNTVESKILAIATEQPQSVIEQRADVPQPLSDLIDEMLRKDPTQRPATANDVIQRIRAIEQPLVEALPQISVSPVQKDDRGSRTNNAAKWLIGGGLIGLLLLVAGIQILLRDTEYDLKIEGPDGITIKATNLAEPSEAYTFKTGDTESTLTKGKWKITIVSEGFDNFTLDNDVVEIEGPKGAVVRISKISRPIRSDLNDVLWTEDPDRAYAEWFIQNRHRRLWAELKLRSGPVQELTDTVPEEPFSIESVNFGVRDVVDTFARLRKLQNLHSIDGIFSDEIPDDILDGLPTKELQSLNLRGAVRPAHIQSLQACPKLSRVLFLESKTPGELLPELMEAVGRKVPKRAFCQFGSMTLTPRVTKEIAKWAPDAIRLDECQVTDGSLSNCESLTSIELRECRVNETVIPALARADNLESLILIDVALSGGEFQDFEASGISNIVLGPVSKPELAVQGLLRMPELRSVCVVGPNWTDTLLEKLARTGNVPSIKLIPVFTSASPDGLKRLASLPEVAVEESFRAPMVAPVDHQVATVLLSSGARIFGTNIRAGIRLDLNTIAKLSHHSLRQLRLTSVDVRDSTISAEELATQLGRLDYKLERLTQPSKLWSDEELRQSTLIEKFGEVVRVESDGPAMEDRQRPSDAQVLARLDDVDWRPGEPHQLIRGEVSNPAPIDGMPNWQVGSTFPVGGRLWGVSPKGTYLLVTVEGGSAVYVYRRATGRLHGVIHVTGRHGVTHTWNPNEEELLIRDGGSSRIRIFAPNGKYLRDFPVSVGSALHSHHWSPDGERILVALADAVEMRTPDGTIVDSFAPPETGGDGFLRADVWSPDGSMFALRKDDKMRVYKRDGGQPIYEAQCHDYIDRGFQWHPQSNALAHRQLTDNVMVPKLWTIDGQLRALNLPVPWTNSITFSPGGHFYITGWGVICETGGQKVGELKPPYPGDYSGNLIRWDEPGTITFLSLHEPGNFVEYSPGGKQLRRVERAVPTPVTTANWLKGQNKVVSVFATPYYHNFSKRWVFDWDERGQGGSHRLEDSDWPNSQGTSSQVGWSSADNLFSVNTIDGVRTFNLSGKQVSHLEQGTACEQATWSPDGKKLAVCYPYRKGVVVYSGGKPQKYFENDEIAPETGRRLSWTRDSNKLLAGFYGGARHAVISTDTGKVAELTSRCVNPISPSEKWTAIATESTVTLNAEGEESRQLKFEQPVSFKWWRCHWNSDETQMLLIGGYNHNAWLYDLASDTLTKRRSGQAGIDALWNGHSLLTVSDTTAVSFWPQTDREAHSIALPMRRGNANFATSRHDSVQLGDGSPLSFDERYVSVVLNHTCHHHTSKGGNVCVVDLQEKQVAWTGISFNDGKRAVIEGNGRVREVDKERFDDYLTYMISYPTSDPNRWPNQILPLTRLQFASRIGLSKAQQSLQTVLDVGGTLLVGEEQQAIVADAVADARDLPPVDTVFGVELSDVRPIGPQVIVKLEQLRKLKTIKLNHGTISVEQMESLSKLPDLASLDLSECTLPLGSASLLSESLTELNVSNTNVGDFFLLDLVRLKSLKKLNLSGTEVTPDGVAQLRKQLPDCKILEGDLAVAE